MNFRTEARKTYVTSLTGDISCNEAFIQILDYDLTRNPKYVDIYTHGWSRFECSGLAHCPSRFVHGLSSYRYTYVYCPSIADHEMTHSEKILDYELAQ